MKLVDNWKQAWKWFSVHSMATATAIQGAYIALPDEMRRVIPVWGIAALTMGILAMGIIGRLASQKKKGSDDAAPKS